MATVLYLRNTTANGITTTGDGVVYDMTTVAGAAVDTDTVTLTDGGTQIQWTQSAGGSTIAWISGRVPAGGFTLTTTDISVWLLESNMNDEAVGRYRVFKFTPPSTVTELGGGPFTDNAEMGTAITEMLWAGNVTDTAFAENDRILIRLYASNFTTMTAGTANVQFNAAAATTGDSFFNIAETVAFKAEAVTAAITTVLGTGSINTFGKTVSKAITGFAGTSAINTFGTALSYSAAIVGNLGTGTLGSFAKTISRSLSGNLGTSALGTLLAGIQVTLVGFAGTGSLGSFGKQISRGITGNTGTGAVGLFTPRVSVTLTGFSGTGSVGTLTVSVGGGGGSTVIFFNGVSVAGSVTQHQGVSRPQIALADAGGGTYTVTKTYGQSDMDADSVRRETYLIDGVIP